MINRIKYISTDKAPKAIGPYSQAVLYNDTIYLSGQIGLDPVSMELVGDDFVSQANQIWRNIENILESSNSSINDIIKINVYLTNIKNFSHLNNMMGNIFNNCFPARSTVEVSKLPMDALLEIDVIAGLSA